MSISKKKLQCKNLCISPRGTVKQFYKGRVQLVCMQKTVHSAVLVHQLEKLSTSYNAPKRRLIGKGLQYRFISKDDMDDLRRCCSSQLSYLPHT